jgi:hypothetical protein
MLTVPSALAGLDSNLVNVLGMTVAMFSVISANTRDIEPIGKLLSRKRKEG